MFKRFLILLIAALIAVSTITAQRSDVTVEESYLQKTMEIQIIRETARASTREQKMVALEYINEAIDNGNLDDEIRQTLDFLSREGRRSIVMESGRVLNNFPEVRRESAKLLGKMGTEEARKSLLDVIQIENEPMVIQEIITSLGNIGVTENNDSLIIISWIVSRFDNLNPDNLMALATIDAFEKIANKNNGIDSPEAIAVLVRISEGNYIAPVKERARQLLADLRGYGG
jgi:hypothetical protein